MTLRYTLLCPFLAGGLGAGERQGGVRQSSVPASAPVVREANNTDY